MNDYYLKARFLPTVLTAIPIVVLVIKILSPIYSESFENIYEYLPTVADVGFSAAVVFLGIQVNRFVSKEIFQKLFFKDELKMPTTEYLLWKNRFFSNDMKGKIRAKISRDFRITLPSKEEENENELESRKSIITAVSQIRNSLRGNKLLLQHNIEYGFVRNLIGGSLIASIISVSIIVISYLSEQKPLMITGIILLAVYLIPILLSKWLINRYGKYYSKVLFEQFLSLKIEDK